jgi:hypothetical protein
MQIVENLDMYSIDFRFAPNDGTGIILISSPPKYYSNQTYICLVYFSLIISVGRNLI